MIFSIVLLALLNIFLVEGAEIFSYNSQDCGSDLSGNIQLNLNTCYGMTGGDQKSMFVMNESEDYTVHVWYGNMQCQDQESAHFNYNACCNLDDDEFSVMVTKGDVKSAGLAPAKNVKIDNFF